MYKLDELGGKFMEEKMNDDDLHTAWVKRAIERAHGIGPTALDEQIEAAEFAEAERQIQTGGF